MGHGGAAPASSPCAAWAIPSSLSAPAYPSASPFPNANLRRCACGYFLFLGDLHCPLAHVTARQHVLVEAAHSLVSVCWLHLSLTHGAMMFATYRGA